MSFIITIHLFIIITVNNVKINVIDFFFFLHQVKFYLKKFRKENCKLYFGIHITKCMRSNETDLLWYGEIPAKLVLLLYVLLEKENDKKILKRLQSVEKKSMYDLVIITVSEKGWETDISVELVHPSIYEH